MKPVELWSEEELLHELERYKQKKAFLQEEFAERMEPLDEAISLLRDEIARRTIAMNAPDPQNKT